jgi:hypothetical protein
MKKRRYINTAGEMSEYVLVLWYVEFHNSVEKRRYEMFQFFGGIA